MAITAVLKYQNADSTLDMNSRFQSLFQRGIITGGTLVPVASSLVVNVQPFTAMSDDGMLITSDDAEAVTIPLDQTSIVSLFAQYNSAGEPTLEIQVTEASAFEADLLRDWHVVIGAVTVTTPATEILDTDISYALRERQDRRQELIVRGRLTTTGELPADPNFNFPGDCYVVAAGGLSTPAIYSWSGIQWVDITATAGIAQDLALHRANFFPDEIHMTDDQADAATGSAGAPSASNKYVTEQDPRLPTQDENDALQGSDGSPSDSNRYITQEYPVAFPAIQNYVAPPGGIVILTVASGPVYVGTGAILSEIKYFNFLDYNNERGYVNTVGSAPNVLGTFKDVFLADPLVPSTDADAEGFYTGDLYISIDNTIDTAVRLVYGKETTLKEVLKDFAVTVDTGDNVVPGDAVEKIANIKGRPYTEATPTEEQNINLRSDLDGISAFAGSVLETNIIAGLDDFERLEDDPILGEYFVKNIGVPVVFTYENTGLVNFSYTPQNGQVQFVAVVDFSNVNIGDLFTDGGGDTYFVQAVDDGGNNMTLIDRYSGLFPLAVNSSVGTSLDGSTQINYNPRQLLLSEMKLSNGAEVIKTPRITRILEEFSSPDGLIAWGVERFNTRIEPRIVFYGSWQNFVTSNREEYVRNAATGRFEVTGYFTEVALLMRRKKFSPSLDIKVNNISPAVTVSTSGLNTINAAIGATPGAKYNRVVLATGMNQGHPNHVRADITATTLDTLDVFGFEFVRSDSNVVAALESGRAFDNARIVSRDNYDALVPIFQLPLLGRGGRFVYSVAEQSYGNAIFALQDLDENNTPSGTVNNPTTGITITNGVPKLESYRQGDVIQVVSATLTEIRQVLSITSPVINLTNSLAILPGEAVVIRHICSTDQIIPLTGQETFLARFVLLEDFVNNTPSDLSSADLRDRFVVHHDGHTILAAQNAIITENDIAGPFSAFQIRTADSGSVRFTVLATRLDLLMVNGSAATANVTIDGSPAINFSFDTGLVRRTIMFNARYQTHEIEITAVTGNISIGEIFLFGPFKPELPATPNEVGDLGRIARYVASEDQFLANPYVFPLGTTFYEASQNISYIDGTGTGDNWLVEENFTKAEIYGQYLYSNREGSEAEFYFLGTAFELQFIIGPDHGHFKVQVDGVELESTGGVIVGDYTGNVADAYNALYDRKNIGVSGLAFGYHKVTAYVPTPRTKNASATDFYLAFVGYHVCNEDGYLAMGRDRDEVYTATVDLRNFAAIDTTSSSDASGSTNNRSQKVGVTLGATSVSVVFTEPYVDANYSVTAMWVNTVDAFPSYQPLVVTTQTASGFSLSWNDAAPTSNYAIAYQTESYD